MSSLSETGAVEEIRNVDRTARLLHRDSKINTMPDKGPERWAIKGLLLFLFSAAYLFLFVRILSRVGDEGILVYGAQLVAEGAIPYRDFFEFYGPANWYWLALFFKLFGIKWVVARGVLLLTGVLITVLIYWMTRRLYRGPFDLLPAILYMIIGIPRWTATNQHWDSNLFYLLSVGAFFLWQDRGQMKYLLITGVLAAVTSCFMYQKGLFLLIALFLVQFANNYRLKPNAKIRNELCVVIVGYIGVLVLVVFFFYFCGGLKDLVYATLIWPVSNYHNINRLPYGYGLVEFYWSEWLTALRYYFSPAVSQFLRLVFLLPFLLIAALPLLIGVLTATFRFSGGQRSRIFNSRTLPYWVAGVALWISEIHRMDVMHLIYGSPLLLIVLFFVLNSYDRARAIPWRIALSLVTVAFILFGTFNAFVASTATHKTVTRRGTVYSFNDDAALKFLQQINPGEEVFVYPYYPMYYFLANVTNPTRYSILLYNYNIEAQFDEVVAALDAKKVKFVLWDTVVQGDNLKIWFPQYVHPPKKRLRLEHYLETHYEELAIKNGFRILLRKDRSVNSDGRANSQNQLSAP